LLKSCGAEEAPSDPSTPWQLAHWATNSFDKADFLGVAQISIEDALLDELELEELEYLDELDLDELDELPELLEELAKLDELMLDELLELELLTELIEPVELLELEAMDELADELDELDTPVGEVLGIPLSSPLVHAPISISPGISVLTNSLRLNVIVLFPLPPSQCLISNLNEQL
jgi:hypothetical protein